VTLAARLVTTCLLLLAAAGCDVTVEPAPDSQGRSSAPTCRTTLENCFTYDQMDQFLERATSLVAEFFDTAYDRVPRPQVAYVADGATGRSPCTDPQGTPAAFTDQSYEYCPANRTIYIGQNALWAMYDQIGDAAPVVGLAHEWGHHVQTMTGVPAPRTQAESVNFENQADCVAGGWTKHVSDKGVLEYPDDLRDIGGLLEVIGSREGPARDHGSTRERTQSFLIGFRNGLPGCNRFSPAAPII